MPLTNVIRRTDTAVLAIPAHEVIGAVLANDTAAIPSFLANRVSVSRNRATLTIDTEDMREPERVAGIRDIIVYEHCEIAVYAPEVFAERFRPL